MSAYAIRAEGLGKKYRLGASQQMYGSLRETLTGIVDTPLRLARRVMGHGTGGRVSRPEFWALRDVSFEVKQGDVLGIIGRNGAGKSTLLKVLSEITEPTEGRATMYGRVASLLEVGTGFHPELTGRENIYLNGAILGMSKAEIARKFDEIVAFAEVEKFIDTQVKHYSSGMYLRLAFSVAAHLEPEILIVDEVLAVGDLEFQKKCLGQMHRVANQGRTVLFVSHNMAAMRRLCTQGLLLQSGRESFIGDIGDAIDAYMSLGNEAIGTANLPPPPPNAPGAPTRLYFSTASGEERGEFRIGEKWQVHLKFELYRAVRQMIAAVSISTSEGVRLVTYWSQPRDLGPGEYQITVDAADYLASTGLHFTIGLSSGGVSFYYVDGVGSASISGVAEGEQPFAVSGAGVLVSVQRPEIREAGHQ